MLSMVLSARDPCDSLAPTVLTDKERRKMGESRVSITFDHKNVVDKGILFLDIESTPFGK